MTSIVCLTDTPPPVLLVTSPQFPSGDQNALIISPWDLSGADSIPISRERHVTQSETFSQSWDLN